MTKSMLFFIAVLIVALGARPVLAGDGREYVGETSSSIAPHVGYAAMHALCHLDFPGARICWSSDIFRHGGVGAALPVTGAWVHPSLVDVAGQRYPLDPNGNGVLAFGILSCYARASVRPSVFGFSISSYGRRSPPECAGILPVACCAERKGKK